MREGEDGLGLDMVRVAHGQGKFARKTKGTFRLSPGSSPGSPGFPVSSLGFPANRKAGHPSYARLGAHSGGRFRFFKFNFEGRMVG
jgi:hypothetical protein